MAHPSLAQLSLRAVGVREAARTSGHSHALVDRTFGAFPAVRRGCVRMVRVRVISLTTCAWLRTALAKTIVANMHAIGGRDLRIGRDGNRGGEGGRGASCGGGG